MQDMNIPSEIFLGQVWDIGHQLGSGGFGKVFETHNEAGQPAAVKFIPKGPGAQRELLFEGLDGATNVMPVLDRGEFEDSWVLVMPLAEKSLREYLEESGGQLTANDGLPILIDIVEALAAVEGRVVHRDIKPENILLLNGRWNLADFGIARDADAPTAPDTLKLAKTKPYAAPEQWREERATSATDVYAFGVVAYELLAGRTPFEGPNYQQQLLTQTPGRIEGIPLRLRSLVAACLYKPPEARPRPSSLLSSLKTCLQTASDEELLLQQANARSVEQQAEQLSQLSATRSEEERRITLFKVADQALDDILDLLHEQIEVNAENAKVYKGDARKEWVLNDAVLRVETNKLANHSAQDALPFPVIAHSTIGITIPVDSRGYTGRSHSLWYCDAQEPGVFRWYETAFWEPHSGFGRVVPFALAPEGSGAVEALSFGMATREVALPFTAIDQGEEEEFIKRWLNRFGRAALGQLQYPSQIPEISPRGSWRRKS